MTDETGDTINSRLTGLLGGILSDGEELLKQGLALLRCEIAKDLDSARRAAFLIAAGTAFGMAGLTMLCFTLVHLLSAYYPAVAIWVFFAGVGAPVAVAGALLGYRGARTLPTLSPQDNPVEDIEE